MTKLDEIKAMVAALTVHELADFVATFGVSLSLGALADACAPNPPTYSVVFYRESVSKSAPAPNYIQGIKELRAAQGLGLREAKEAIDALLAGASSFVTLYSGLSFADATAKYEEMRRRGVEVFTRVED